MPTISRKVIERPRIVRRCSRCREVIEGATARLYGYAHEGEKPYVIYEHADPQVCKDNESAMCDRLARPVAATGSTEDMK
jgi:hypothetical protein